MEFVELVNRTKKQLMAVWDGRHYDLKPGKQMVPRSVAIAAIRQNPIMGTEDPENPARFQSLVGVEEWKMPVDPVEQTTAPQRVDRSQMIDPNANNYKLRSYSRPVLGGARPNNDKAPAAFVPND